MIHQPDDEFITENDDNEFINLDDDLKVFIYSQSDNSILNTSGNNDSSPSLNESLALNNRDEIPTNFFNIIETSSSPEISLGFDEPLFPDVDLGESFSNDLDNGTNNESEHSIPMDMPTESNSNSHSTEIISEKINLTSVDKSIQEQLISVIIQPTINSRRRYKCEGKRRIKKLRAKPMTIDLSQLKKYKLKPSQFLRLRIALITCTDKIYIHSDILKYHSKGIIKFDDGSVGIRITQTNIDEGKIELKDLSIIKTKDNKYNFKLIPYNLLKINDQSDIYIINEKKTPAGNAKEFRKKYNIQSSRIACQIIIEENKSYEYTHITCETDIMTEQKYQPKGKKRRNLTKRKKSSY